MGRLGYRSSVYLGPWVIGNGPHVLGDGPPVLGNGPHLCTQFMNRVILIMGGKQFYKKQSYKKNY